MDVDKRGVATATNGGYGFITTKPEYVEGAFNLIPITDSIL
jgi:hypothetical protein